MKCAADYRQMARNALKGNWPMAMLTGFVASLMGGSLISYGSSGSSSSSSTDSFIQEFQATELWLMIKSTVIICSVILLVWIVVTILIAGAAKLGYAVFNLNLVDGKKADLTDLFSQFNRFGTGFCMNFLVGMYIFLWSLLFVIPGIIKSYSYAMAPYILAENPHLTANEAITESRRVMNGNKWRLFCLHFSFIGWHLLCAVPMLIAGILFFTSSVIAGNYIGVLFLIPCAVLSFAGILFVHPYQEAAQAAFYRDITAPVYTENQPTF